MSNAQATHVPVEDSGAPTTAVATRPVTLISYPLSVVDEVQPARRPTSGVPIVGYVTPAPNGQSVLDRALRRLLVELVRSVLWIVLLIPAAAVGAVLLAKAAYAAAVPARTGGEGR